jgi:hypothetical protein
MLPSYLVMFGVSVSMPSTTRVILLLESVNSASYMYLPGATLAVVLADKASVKVPLAPPKVTVKLTALEDV